MSDYFKDFDSWNKIKKNINGSDYLPYFDSAEIWWCVLGINIGAEIDGKGEDFLRPILVLRKYNQFGCLIISLSSAREVDKSNISAGIVQGKSATANLSQIRSISSQRLIEKIQVIDKDLFLYIQKTAMEYNFPLQSFDIPSSNMKSSPQANIRTTDM